VTQYGAGGTPMLWSRSDHQFAFHPVTRFQCGYRQMFPGSQCYEYLICELIQERRKDLVTQYFNSALCFRCWVEREGEDGRITNEILRATNVTSGEKANKTYSYATKVVPSVSRARRRHQVSERYSRDQCGLFVRMFVLINNSEETPFSQQAWTRPNWSTLYCGF
jgi:hypothetical protein